MKSKIIRSIYILLLMTAVAGCKKGEPEIPTEEGRILALDRQGLENIYNLTKLTYLYNEKFITAYPTFIDFAKELSNRCSGCSEYGIVQIAVEVIKESSQGLDRFSNVLPEKGLPGLNGEVLPDDDPRAKLNIYKEKYGSGMQVYDQDNYLLVKMVDKGSPAYELGIRRGMRIVSINGKPIIQYSNKMELVEILYGIEPFELVIKEVTIGQMGVEVLTSKVHKIIPQKYVYNPVAVSKQINNKTGYMVLSSFNNNDAEKQEFDNFFNALRDNNSPNLILDLRYNGGGQGSSADNLVNKILPNRFNGQSLNEIALNMEFRTALDLTEITFNEDGSVRPKILPVPATELYSWLIKYKHWNEEEKKWEATGGNMFVSLWDMYRRPPQVKADSDSPIKNVYILISEKTASASELLINNLRPYVNVILIGTPSDGKQVGVYPFEIANFKFNLVTYSHSNKDSQVVPAEGFQPGVYKAGKDQSFESLDSEELNIDDNATYDFGSNDLLVKKALELISKKIPN